MRELDENLEFEEKIEQINSLLNQPDGRKYIKENFGKIKKLLLHKLNSKHLNCFFGFVEKLK